MSDGYEGGGTAMPQAELWRRWHAKLAGVSLVVFQNFSISEEDKKRIQRVQNPVDRFIFNWRRFDHVSSIRDKINLLPKDEMYKIFINCMVHKILSLNDQQTCWETLILGKLLLEKWLPWRSAKLS